MNEYFLRLLADTAPLKERFAELDKLIAAPEIAAHGSMWRRLVWERAALETTINARDLLEKYIGELDKCDKALTDSSTELKTLLIEEKEDLEKKSAEAADKLKNSLLPLDEKQEAVTLEIRSNDNRIQSAELCQRLFEMYKKYSDSAAFDFEIQDIDHLESGIKSAAAGIVGKGAYARLKHECGIHRTADKFSATVTVLPKVLDKATEIQEKDIRIDIFHSGGAGGQNINKVETAVRITHFPTGIVVVCQDERSQLKNKDRAMKTLSARVDEYYRSQTAEEQKKIRNKAKKALVRTYDFELNCVTDHGSGKVSRLDSFFYQADLDTFYISAKK